VVGTLGVEGQGPGEFIYPTAVVQDDRENLYVCEYGGNDRVQKFTVGGKFILAFGGFERGNGKFQRQTLWRGPDLTYGSSLIDLVDLDGDGDLDVLYTNGDAFDNTYVSPWHGVQWLENKGGLKFEFHRIADFPGAYSARALDVDSDGDLDVFAVSAFNDWDKPDAQSFVWYENDGRMGFTAHDLASSPTHLLTLEIGDFDGDGRSDFVTGGMHICPPFDRLGRVTLWKNHWRDQHPGAIRGELGLPVPVVQRVHQRLRQQVYKRQVPRGHDADRRQEDRDRPVQHMPALDVT
jgi:hypothetical protein